MRGEKGTEKGKNWEKIRRKKKKSRLKTEQWGKKEKGKKDFERIRKERK